MLPERFTYPFCYVPRPEIVGAAQRLIARIDASEGLRDLFGEGKMMGVLEVLGPGSDEPEFLYGFSGLAAGRSMVDGFVPPVYDTEKLVPAVSAEDSRRIQDSLFDRYKVLNGLGQEASIKEIFALRGLVPPGGTGDCAAPKLLNHAFRNGLKPLAMGEFWYGRSPGREVREQGRFYPSCTGKCGPLLSWMMQGLDVEPNPLDKGFSNDCEPRVIFSDEAIIVVSKPAGMLSVPGRTAAPSLLGWLQERFGEVHSCHRLDMDTSGIMVFARSVTFKTALELQFASREVRKTYRARLVAPSMPASAENATRRRDLRKGAHGTVALPLMTDWEDRPRQMVDDENGKMAITEYEVVDTLPDGEVEVIFTPHTGRSHQLRVHAAHSRGLGRPIKGDRLYGDASGGRLYLHAESISFRHPVSGETVSFSATC